VMDCVGERGRLRTTVEDCLQNSEASCGYESHDLVLYRGFVGAIRYLCGPSRRGIFFCFLGGTAESGSAYCDTFYRSVACPSVRLYLFCDTLNTVHHV